MNMAKLGLLAYLSSVLLVVEAFSPFSTRPGSHTSSTHLFMNKKKAKKAPAKGKAQGFASALKSLSNKSFPYAGTIRPGKQSPQRVVLDENIVLPDYAVDGIAKKGSSSPLLPWVIEVKKPKEIEKMRAAGKLARDVLDMAGRAVAVGVTTDEIDALVHEASVKVRPTFLTGVAPDSLSGTFRNTNNIMIAFDVLDRPVLILPL